MPTSPFLFAKPILHLIVLSRQRIGPSRRSRTDRPAYAYKIRIGKFHNTTAKFLSIESFGCHNRFYCQGSRKQKSSKSGQISYMVLFPREKRIAARPEHRRQVLWSTCLSLTGTPKNPALSRWLVVVSFISSGTGGSHNWSFSLPYNEA
jgi:hypothetical protein